MQDPGSVRSPSLRSTSRRRDGQCAMGHSCRVQENPALFSLLGTTYGGDGENNFALPDLRGRVPSTSARGPVSPFTPSARTVGARA